MLFFMANGLSIEQQSVYKLCKALHGGLSRRFLFCGISFLEFYVATFDEYIQ